jgi:hypothetical protein
MRRLLSWRVAGLFLAAFAATLSAHSQQGPDPFRWMDFHAQKDQDIVVWVTQALGAEKWSAIREIGVEYDAALVVTTLRAAPDASPSDDSVNVWSVNLTNHALTPLLKGYNLRWANFMTFSPGDAPEPAALYEGCIECAPDVYFTAFHYDRAQHIWAARFMRGGQAAPIWNANPAAGVDWTQAYAGLAEPTGRSMLGTWIHIDHGAEKPAEDFVYRYDLDPLNNLERTQLLSGKDADAMKLRVCRTADAMPGLARGQDSPLCRQLINPKPERKPVTTPPANNHGKSVPPGSRHTSPKN